MARKIVLLRTHEWLVEGFQRRSMASSLSALESNMKVPSGLTVQKDVYPVRIPVGAKVSTDSSGDYRGADNQYLIAVEVDDESVVDEFNEENDDVVGVFSDPQISICPVVNPSGPVGQTSDVETALSLNALRASGGSGQGVKIVVVDTGIDGTQINVSGGFSPRPGVAPGTSTPDHGTMVAYDALIAAPNAMIYDYALLQSGGVGWVGFLSDAIRAFSEIMVLHLQTPGPMIAVNSWAMYDRSQDATVGNPQNYSRNPTHPFNQITGALVGSGIDVVFAAGNCGANCPDSRCGSGDTGSGNSIHGANSHPSVLSVAAVTVNDDRLCYSSQGPGGLNAQTPDISGFSHFSGSGIYPADGGTSAACPVVAGVIAAIRSTPKGRNLTPVDMKDYLTQNARSVHGPGWSGDYGWGIVDADAAFNAIP